MRGETIKVACEGAALMDIDELHEYQGELKSLSKENYQKLRTEIVETGFGFPFRVWRHEGKAFIIGGHQAKRTLIQMRDEEGYSIPRLPVSFTEARTYEEAKRRVLQDVTQYGSVDSQGLYQFMHDAKFDIGFIESHFDLPDTDIEEFKTNFFKETREVNFQAGTVEEQGKLDQKKPVKCPECGCEFVPKG